MLDKENLLETIQNKLLDIFSQDKKIIAVYLFGSYADKSAHEGSDLDMGIMIDPAYAREFTLSDEFDLEVNIEARLNTDRFDLVIINKVQLTLQFRIISPAKLIYVSDDDKRCEMEEQIMVKYYDFEPRLKQFNREYFSTLREEYMR